MGTVRWALVFAVVAMGCDISVPSVVPDGAVQDDGSVMVVDAGVDSFVPAVDSGTDSGSVVDAGTDSGAVIVDAGADSGMVTVDAGSDAGSMMADAGVDAGPGPVVGVSAGSSGTCAVRSGGSVNCVGASAVQGNDLMVGPVHGILDAVEVAVQDFTSGPGHVCALRSTGAIACWGQAMSGQLGELAAPWVSSINHAVATRDITTATQVMTSGKHSCAVLADGTVWCWGGGTGGASDANVLGNPAATSATKTPVQVIGPANAVAVSSSGDATCALIADGTVGCWGAGSYVVQSIAGAKTISVAGSRACSVAGASNQVFCWTIGSAATMVPGLSAVLDVRVSGTGSYCARMTNHVYCWGANGIGQVGIGSAAATVAAPTEVLYGGAAIVSTDLDVGYDHVCVLTSGGAVLCWGSNNAGMCGASSGLASYSSPVVADLL